MPRWDFECEKCGHVAELTFPSFKAMQDAVVIYCKNHCGPLVRLPSAPSFTVTGFNSKNNYSRG